MTGRVYRANLTTGARREVPHLDLREDGGAATATRFVVQAPAEYANALLNGSECVVVTFGELHATCYLLSGPCAGREWSLDLSHLSPLAKGGAA